MTLQAMDAVRRLQKNPALGACRMHAAVNPMGIALRRRPCGRILEVNRALDAELEPDPPERQPRSMPFAADRQHQS